MSGDPVQPNQREHVELETVNWRPEPAIVANNNQIQYDSLSSEAPASSINICPSGR